MTQNNGNGSRLDRLEAIMLDLAAASVRHDNEFSRINATLAQIAEQQQESAIRLTQIAEQQQQSANRHTQHEEAIARIDERLESITAQQGQNTQNIGNLTASIQELRNMLADYIEGRSNKGR